jgi:hypothetical protein
LDKIKGTVPRGPLILKVPMRINCISKRIVMIIMGIDELPVAVTKYLRKTKVGKVYFDLQFQGF